MFEQVPINVPESQYVLALMAVYEDQVFASGSAVLIGPHVALTARHVTDDFENLFARFRTAEDEKRRYSIFARGHVSGAWVMFVVDRIFNAEATDVCALALALYEDETFAWPIVTLNLMPPRRHRHVWSWGHITPNSNFADFERGEIHWHANLARSRGTVLDIFPRMRDRGMGYFPCFHFTARVDHSMSGGPIFDDLGLLVGINASSWNTSNNAEFLSTGSLLWPVMALPYTPSYPIFEAAHDIKCIADLRELGFVQAAYHLFVDVDRNAADGELRVSVRIPADRL